MLRDGKSTPQFVEHMLSMFGHNPHGKPNYRLIWSERKMIWFAGGMSPEYAYLEPQGWVLETWTPPEKDAGLPEDWMRTTRGILGPYPREGTYNFVNQYPSDWLPTEDAVKLICVGLQMSKDIPMKQRADAIREVKEQKKAEALKEVADAIVECQDSASLMKIQQPVSGPRNNLRGLDDCQRDMEHAIVVPNLPKRGGKIL